MKGICFRKPLQSHHPPVFQGRLKAELQTAKPEIDGVTIFAQDRVTNPL
jgi:hypothetical protein